MRYFEGVSPNQMCEGTAVYMVGDWTNVDPVIGAFLQRYHSSGVPLYFIFKGRSEGRVLPTVATASLILNALMAAAR